MPLLLLLSLVRQLDFVDAEEGGGSFLFVSLTVRWLIHVSADPLTVEHIISMEMMNNRQQQSSTTAIVIPC